MREPNDAAKSAKQTANSANEAADQALEIAKFTTQQADRTAAAKAEIDQRFPTDHALMVRALASQEQAATLRIGPRRNCWQELLTYEERLGEIEQRRAALIEEIAALNLKLQEESSRHTAALASWMEADEEGERPASRASELQAAIADRQAEYDALGFQYDATLQKRAEHVTRNRNRFLRDVGWRRSSSTRR